MSKIPNILKYKNSTLGEHRGNKRIWIDKARLNETDFKPGRFYDIDAQKRQVTIYLFEEGERVVSQRNGEPVIDINNRAISEALKGINEVTMRIEKDRIVITPLKEEIEQKRSLEKFGKKKPTFIDCFSGGGTLTEAFKAHGGIPVAAIEIEDSYLSVYEKNNPNTTTFSTPLQKLDVSLLPDADILLAGIPCECYSKSGISKRNSCGIKSKEAGDTGYLGYFVLQIIGAIRPSVAVIEEVPPFANSAMADVVRGVLKSFGYHLSETILDGEKMGSMTTRKRYCMVASMKKGFKFTYSRPLFRKTFGDILETPIEEREWMTEENSKTIQTFFRRMEEHKAKGNGFSMGNVFDVNDVLTGTFTKGYMKRRLTDPILRHPTKDGHYSMLSPRELARIHDLPEDYILPDSKTTAAEIIGQGVDGNMFKAVAKNVIALVA